MECALGLVALLGLVFIATGVLYYRRPDIQWRVQKWHLEFWGSIRAEQGGMWGCWSRVGALTLIGTGLWILWTAASGYSQFQSSNATRSASLAIYTAAAARNANAKATARAGQPDIARLETIFPRLMATLKARAQNAPGEILLLSDAERRRYGLENSPVYFGICGDKSSRQLPVRFYVIVENWGLTQAKYQYSYGVGVAGSPGTECGSWLVYNASNRWVLMPADSFDYAAELQRIRSAATATRHFGPAN